MLSSILLGGALLAHSVFSQQTTYIDPAVPTGTPVPGNYTGGLRPQVHFSPPQNFMNDPNGLFVDANGTWHLYYQYNPTAPVAGNQHWGHATSQDLYHWLNQPIALFPPEETTYVFSGSAVIDVNNTSGMFPDQDNGVVAIYTLASYPDGAQGPQEQAVAFSYDGGFTFEPYENNPVIPSNSPQFRDPKVIWYEDHWVMVVSHPIEFTIEILTSENLLNWTHASNFTNHGLLGLQYECPNMVRVPVEDSDDYMWVMWIAINPGAPLGGSISQYFIGEFNGTHFTPVDSAARIADFAKDNYAGQFFYGSTPGEEAISIDWASNWQYTSVVPTGELEGWRSSTGLPRRNFITNATRIGYVLAQLPYDLSPVIGDELASNKSLGNSSVVLDYSDVESNALYFEVNITNAPSTGIPSTAGFNLTWSSPISGDRLEAGYYLGGDQYFFINRGGVKGFDNPFFTNSFSTNPLLTPNETWTMSGVIDRSILEVFLDAGKYHGTVTFFPESPLTVMTVGAIDLPEDVEISYKVWGLESAWAQYENENGTVVGNVTESGNSTSERRGLEYRAF